MPLVNPFSSSSSSSSFSRSRAGLVFAASLAALTLAVACGGDSDDGDDGSSSGGSSGASGASGSSGSPSSGDFLGSCDTRSVAGPSAGQCRDWSGTGMADLSVSCDGLDGAFSATTPCPEAERVGTCTLEPVLGVSATYGYYAPDYTSADAEDHCDGLDGSFLSTGIDNGSGGSGGNDCPPECFRAYECVAACGDEPTNYGCCPCPEGMIDILDC
jgi:hypothetical protein